MTERESIDHVWAGLLNGTIITAIGGAFPVFFLWRLIAGGADAISDMRGMSLTQFGQGWATVVFSVLFLRAGCRLLTDHVRALRNR